YESSLSSENHKTDTTLSTLLNSCAPGLSTYEFLRCTEFETSGTLERMQDQLRERLRNMVSNLDAAFNALWVHLDHLGARMSSDGSLSVAQHRFTKSNLDAILNKAGA